MKNTKTISEKVFLGFGILTVLSGIYLIVEQDYFIGISGSIVGMFLIYLNVMKPT